MFSFTFRFFRAGIDDYTGNYKCTLRQKHGRDSGSGRRMGYDIKIGEKKISISKSRKEWSGESVFKYGDFFLPSWMLESDMDGNFSFLFWAIQEIGKTIDDVPLRDINDVIQSVEKKR